MSTEGGSLCRIWHRIRKSKSGPSIALLLLVGGVLAVPVLHFLKHKSDITFTTRLEAVTAGLSMSPQVRIAPAPPLEQDDSTTSARIDYDSLLVVSRVLEDGSPVDGAIVWAVARDTSGNSFSPTPQLTGEDGSVNLGPIPTIIGPDRTISLSRVTVRTIFEQDDGHTIMRETILRLDDSEVSATIIVSRLELFFVAFLLILSIALGMFELPGSKIQTQYFLEVLLTVLLCIALAWIVLEGARVVDNLEQQTGATSISMGFIQLVKASYLSGETPDDWIVTCAPHENGMPGFGAPLWVILMSVIGAVLIAIGVILRGLGTCRLDASTPDGRKKIHAASHNLVKHQMLILFAPLGAMFLYQIMLLTGTADENLTVGLAALAAGGGMNALLNKAHGLVASLLQSEQQRAGKEAAQKQDNESA